MSSPEQPATPAPARRNGLMLRAGIVGGLFAASLLLSTAGRVWLAPQKDHGDPAPEAMPAVLTSRPQPGRPAAPEPAVERLERADRHYRELNHAAALAIYKALLGETPDPARGALQYRIAQCQEALGNWDKALAAYRQVASDETLAHGRAAAQLAQARVLIRMQRHDEARHLLFPLTLTGNAPRASRAVVAAAHYWLALVLSRTAMPEPLPASVAPISTVSRYPVEIGPDLAAPPPVSKAKQKQATGLSEAIIIPQEAPDKEKVVRRASFRSRGAHDLFDVIAKTAGLQLEWTPQARQATADRTLSVELEDVAVADLVASLVGSCGLVCQQDGDRVRFATVAEASPEARRAFQIDLARRASRAAIARQPGHALAPAVYLYIGNLEATTGDLQAALHWYEQLLRERPTSPLAVTASFNQGVLHLQQGHFDTGRQALFGALDRAPGHELAPQALLHIGRTCLEEGDLKRGLALLRRGRTLAVGAECEARVALTLAAGLLIANEPLAAHDTLLALRPRLRQDSVRATAALLDAMARYRAARAQGPARIETADLIAALAQDRDPCLLGPLETYLCCRSFRELGLWGQAVTSCEHALPQTRGPMTAALQVTLGEALLHFKKPVEAARLFQAVAQGKEARWVAEARYHLAALELDEGRAGECVSRCVQIWREQPCADRAALLRLWGTAYERLGAHDRAARCFAGTPPE